MRRRGLVWSLLGIIIIAAGGFAATVATGRAPLRGLDLEGGVSVVLKPTGTANGSQLQEAVNIIDRRVNGLGVSNSEVNRQGNDVVISLPNVKNSQAALNELGETAVLYFRPVSCEIPAYAPPAATTPSTTVAPKASNTTTPAKSLGAAPSARLTSAILSKGTTTPTTLVPTSGPGPTAAQLQQACSSTNASQIPSTPVSKDLASANVILPDYTGNIRYVLGPADMTGSGVSNATVQVDPTTGQYTVLLTFTGKGTTEFDKLAASRYACYQQNTSNPPFCSLESVELDGVVQSAPTIQASSFHGSAVISGASSNPFTSSQASALALVLKYGSLPVRFVPQQVETVSATIGSDTLHAGLYAGIGGLIVVILYMLLYYRALGLVVVTGLCVGGALLYSIITELSYSSFHLTLTISGIVGIIVSIGITVDSYVVYFERLKDEVRAGRTVRQSVERSFARAFRTVLTADLVSFLAALILWALSIGDVRGFAFMLGLSTLLDVFTAYFFIRPAVILVGRRRSITNNPVFGIARGLGSRIPAAEA